MVARLSDASMFVEAERYRRRLCVGIAIAALALATIAAPFADPIVGALVDRVAPPAPRLALAAALLLFLAGLCGAALAAQARARMLRTEQRLEDLDDPAMDDDARVGAFQRAAWPAGWPAVLSTLTLSGAAAAASILALRVPIAPVEADPLAVPAAVAGLVLGLPLVVVERHLACVNPSAFPEAASLARLARVVVATLLCLGMGKLAANAGWNWTLYAPRIVAILTLGVGLELVARALARAFTPFAVPDHDVGLSSAIAGLLRLERPAPGAVKDAIRDTLGIDVSRSFALNFIRRAIPAAGAGLGAVAWLASGLVALPATERAVYERLGVPVAVLAPGLHVVAPWPIGRLRRVELGRMHDLALGLSDAAARDDGADRLWDRPHPGDAAYLIASETEDHRQSFEVVDIDMRILWRVGEGDSDALDAAYAVETPDVVIRGLAGRLLARRFAGSTLPAVLVADRAAFIDAFKADLQAECDALHIGARIAAVIIEAIHPPAGAASAYHAVQASEIEARVAIAQARGAAVEADAQTRRDATTLVDTATALGAEIVAGARTEALFFDADLASATRDGQAFLLERRLERIGTALPARQIIILDHRLGAEALPLLDLRGAASPLP